jgi:iron complex outermembrane recepter protein
MTLQAFKYFLKNFLPTGGFPLLKGLYPCRPIKSGLAMRSALIPLAAFWLAAPWALAAEEDEKAKAEYYINLPRQSVAESLNQLARQTGKQFLFSYELAKQKNARPVLGRYTLLEAIEHMLKDSGLKGGYVDGVLTILDANEYDKHQEMLGPGNEVTNRGSKKMNIKKNTLLTATIAYLLSGGVAEQVVAQKEEARKVIDATIEEIVVTAQKREESLSDVPMAISALSGDIIDKRNLVSMDDYLRTIPGVSFQDRGAGQNSIVIRGITTSPQTEDSTTGAYFGEVPIANISAASLTGSAGNVDIKLVDIERIEVLRGPQGTLYGAGSMAGTVRIIPKAPQLDKMEGSLGGRYSNTGDNGGGSTMIQGVLNVPLVQDRLALRAVAYRVDNSGFNDNVAASQPTSYITNLVNTYGVVAKDRDDRGSDTYTGFRLAALWQINDKLHATLTYMQQEIEQDGFPEVTLDSAGDYQQQRPQIGVNQGQDEFMESDLDLTNLTINYDLGWGVITSATSWLENTNAQDADIGVWLLLGPYYAGVTTEVEVLAEELRFASQWEGPLQLVGGFYYEEKKSNPSSNILGYGDPALDPFGLLQGEPLFTTDRRVESEQKAVFGEVSYDLTEQWTATVGVRHFDYDYKNQLINTFLGTITQNPQISADETGQTYKGVLSYELTEDLLFYSQWAQGFRFGQAQVQTLSCTNAGITVPDIDSDRSETLELGMKSTWLDSRVVVNAAVYQTDWDDIPVSVTTGCFRTLNAGKAQSKGVEIELSTQLTDNLQLDISASTVEATLEETSSIGNKGDDLPGSADYNASVGIEYNFAVADYPSFARLDYAYVGEYYSNVQKTGTPAGDFSQLHLKVGAQIGQMNVDLFVNNLTNEDGLTWVESVLSTLSTSNRGYRIRPRTIGMNIGYRF